MDFIDVFYFGALLVLPFVLYKISLPSNQGREKRIKDWYYALKRLLCYSKMEKFMNRKLSLSSNVPNCAETEWQEDTLVFHGCDLDNNAIYVRFSVGKSETFQDFAEILVQLRLKDGRTFTLPDEEVLICSLKRREWRTKILTIIPLLNGNYRLIFNGFLKQIRTNNKENTEIIEHLSFNFFFSRATDTLAYPKFYDRALFADAICREQWRDGNWTHKLGDAIGTEHFGTVHGTIHSANFNVNTTWNLVAHQSRMFGTADRYNVDKDITMFAMVDDGTVIHVKNKRITHPGYGSCQVRYGAVLLPSGNCIPITGCDIPLPSYHGTMGNMTVHIETKEKQLKTVLHLNDDTVTKFSSKHDFGWDMTNVMADGVFPGSNGKVSLIFFKTKQGDGFKMPEPLVGSRQKYSVSPKLIIPLEQMNAQNVNQTGGKGQSLAILASLQTELHFKVPKGFVITTQAMDVHFRSNVKIREAIAQLKLAWDTKKIQSACQNIQDLITETPLPEDIEKVIVEVLRQLSQKDGSLVAVRSSGVAEDSETSSAAGQNETYLGLRGDAEILEAVRKCWASLYSFRSVEYRRNRGLDVETSMGVVVQEMIDSRIAGVLFTCDLDGNASRMRITANYGLGESIVSGEEGGDVILVKRTWNQNVSVESVQANNKKTKITLNKETSGTKTVYLSELNAKALSMCDEEILTLAKVATQLETKYGRHLDIEWAFEENKLVLLQARPVTFLENWTNYELEHEFDHPIMSKHNVYTTANVKEVMPGAMTPLANSTICTLVDKSVAKVAKRQKIVTKREHIITLRHHIFMNYYQILMVAPPDTLDLTTQSIDVCVCGHSVTTQAMLNRAHLMHGKTTTWKLTKNVLNMLKCCYITSKHINLAKQLAAEPMKITESMTLHDIVKHIDHHMELFEQVIHAHSLASRASSFYQMVSLNVLGKEGDGTLTAEKFGQIALLFSNGSGVISAEIPSDLEDIATAIRKSGKRQEFIAMDVKSVDRWLANNIPEANEKYVKFLEQHGHRSFREFEVMEESWASKPETIMKMLQTLAKMDGRTKKSSHLSIDEVIEQIGSNMSKKVLKFLIGKCRSGVVDREKSKSEVVRHINTIRGGFKMLGNKLHRLQYLPQEDLVYFMTYQEIKHLIATRDPILVTKAMRRSRLYQSWNAYKFPEMTDGIPQPVSTLKHHRVTNADAKLHGTPVCPGLVTARCCCIDDLEHIDQLAQGDILVTHGTDVGWTPYFPMLSGVVTELGGLISHGAVVAREYGLPCLIGVKGALDTFRTGDQVTLDANNGVIYKIKRASN